MSDPWGYTSGGWVLDDEAAADFFAAFWEAMGEAGACEPQGRSRAAPPPPPAPPPAPPPREDPHQVLGVPRGASAAVIKKAYRQLVKQHHPDAGGDQADFIRVKQAYEALS